MIHEGKEYRQVPGYSRYWVSADGEVIYHRLWPKTGDWSYVKVAQHKHRVRGKEHEQDNAYLYAMILRREITTTSGEIVEAMCTRPTGVHRLVALAWLGLPPKGKKCVNHINGRKMDNRAENLEWTVHRENVQHAYDTGLRKSKSGSEHHRYGKKASSKTKAMMSKQKMGENHPKFKGWYERDGQRWASARQASIATGVRQTEIAKYAKTGIYRWNFIPK